MWTSRTARVAALRTLRHRRRYNQAGVAIEKVQRLEAETDLRQRHHRPVLGPNHVVCSKRVPDHHVRIDDDPLSIGLRLLDLWFERQFKKTRGGYAELTRFADDYVAVFHNYDEAVRSRRENG
jgi:hypothetical protein